MEHNEAVYEQIIEVNNGNQATEYYSQHIEQEVVVQNDENQKSRINYEISNMDIILQNDCINVQDSNVAVPVGVAHDKPEGDFILHHESNKQEHVPHVNNIVENVIGYNESHKEAKAGEYVFHVQTNYQDQQSYEVNNSVVNKTEVDQVISEAIVDTSESVPISNVNESVPALSENVISDNHDSVSSSQSVSNNVHAEKNAVGTPDQVLPSEYSADSAQTDKAESMEVETTTIAEEVVREEVVTEEVIREEVVREEVVTEEVVTEENVKEQVDAISKEPESELISNKDNKETSDGHSSESNAHQNEEVNIADLPNVVGEQVLINSDDVAVLTEYSSMEYNMQDDVSEEIVGAKFDEVKVTQPEEISGNQTENEVKSNQLDTNDENNKEDEVLIIKEKEKEEVIIDISTNEEKVISIVKTDEELNTDQPLVLEELENEPEDTIEIQLSTQSTENQRKVIQDIFDDWTDENGEEDVSQPNETYKDHHDSVELELQNLLNEEEQVQTVSSTNTSEHVLNDTHEAEEKRSVKSTEKTRSDKASKKSVDSKTRPIREPSHSRSTRSSSQDLKQKAQAPRPGVKVPGLHLTSPIASTAEVTEVLNKRLKEKQKDLQTPKQPDIVLIKKITQRLSNQLSQGMPTGSLPSLVSIPTKDTSMDKSIEEVSSGEQNTSKTTSETDNNELLAILEGDVDPDWSNIKPMESKTSSSSTAGKLDPIMEREIALKQLLELPNVTSKKSPVEKVQKKTNKKTEKQTGSRSSGKSRTRSKSTGESEAVNSNTTTQESPKKNIKEQKENTNQNSRSDTDNSVELSVEESRSGRKRKLTEKAREHELTVKRQKVIKGKTITETRKSDESSKKKDESSSSAPAEMDEIVDTSAESNPSTAPTNSTPKEETKETKTESKQSKSEAKTNIAKGKLKAAKQQKIGLMKKDVRISKRKLAVKNLMRQKVSNKKAAAAAKAKDQTPAASKSSTTNKSASEKLTSPAAVPKQKKISEIDRLLQDEGVVNLLYNVEQPDSKKRLVPLTKSHKKVVDVEKAERELNLRAKLVKNAVLRLNTTTTSTVSPSQRSRRSANTEQPSPQPEKKPDTPKPSKQGSSMPVIPSNFVMPAKIRNAADASRIIRRHSSSSFSSASASPRVSVDMTPELLNLDESETQTTKAKRKLSNDSSEKVESKKTKKKVASKTEPKEAEAKEDKSLVKKITRSNVATAATAATAVTAATAPTPGTSGTSGTSGTAVPAKITPKSKKAPKGRTSADTMWDEVKNSSKDQDELSACLAEAVSALSSINGSSRSSSASSSRKKGSATAAKASTTDENVGTKKFSNKEINVRQHGHLVQLIMTPSAPVSGIRNAITIPVMNEICEALSILKNDDECRVVLFTSTGTSFCEGLELSYLLHSNKDERKAKAEEMSATVKEFIRTLSTFSKPIVAGVQGAAIGLGVTMLPLFDLVIASDKATFCTPYGKLGQIAEGAAILTLSHSLGSAVTNELLLGGRILTASEALRAGLVTRVLWPDRFQGELLPSLKGMSEQSAQSMEATKALLRQSFRQKLDASLESETTLLIKHWCSPECQEAIKVYIDEKGQ